MASELTRWYPRLEDCSPRSAWSETPPNVEMIEAAFGWPVFIKGSVQTARHARSLFHCRVGRRVSSHQGCLYRDDPILHWQTIVIREDARLRLVGGGLPDDVPPHSSTGPSGSTAPSSVLAPTGEASRGMRGQLRNKRRRCIWQKLSRRGLTFRSSSSTSRCETLVIGSSSSATTGKNRGMPVTGRFRCGLA